MGDTTTCALDVEEREMIDEFIERLKEVLRDQLVAVWLYGSRARGERHEESDVDLLVLVRSDGDRHASAMHEVSADIQLAHGRWVMSPHCYDLDWLDGRREIRAFFIQEVDRDKVVLYGDDL